MRDNIISLFLKAGDVVHTSLDLDSRIYAILICLIAGCIFGFSRVFLLLKNEEKDMLEGKMGVGPISREDAEIIWHQMIEKGKSLEDILLEGKVHSREIMLLNPLAKKLAFPFSKEDEFITHCLRQRKVFKVKKTLENSGIGRRLLDLLETEELICVPLSVDKEVMGILLADNWHSQEPIVDSNIKPLVFFAYQIELAIKEALFPENILEFTQFTSPVFQLKDINEIIEDVCQSVEGRLNRKGIEILKFLSPVPYLKMDEFQIRYILFSLIQNLIESMFRGGKLQVKTVRKGKFVKLEIANMSSEDNLSLPEGRILSSSLSTIIRNQRLRFDLFITKYIVEQHQGELSVEGKEKKGMLVSIYLPFK